MTQAPPAIFKIPTKSPQAARKAVHLAGPAKTEKRPGLFVIKYSSVTTRDEPKKTG